MDQQITLFYEGSGVETGSSNQALVDEGLILLILHIHMYFRYTKTQRQTDRVRETDTNRQTDR